MNTLVWRLNRSQMQISAAALGALAVLLLITGIAMTGTYHGFPAPALRRTPAPTVTVCCSGATAYSTPWCT
jgi:uncharacterized oligopeptide transporter (OPT) family protein